MPLDLNAAHFATVKCAISPVQVKNVLTLIVEEECTIPFIARYRKEQTQGLDEVQLRDIQEAYEEYQEREKRREYILETLKKMEVLTPELEKMVKAAQTIQLLEDIYAPYKQKKKSKAMIAREAGLEPIATLVLTGPLTWEQIIAQEAAKYLNPEKKIATIEDVMAGAKDIVMETMAHDVDAKETLRKDYWKEGKLVSEKRKGAEDQKDWQKYKDYFEFAQNVKELTNPKNTHRFLAMRRAMTAKILKVEVSYDQEAAMGVLRKKYFQDSKLGCLNILEECALKSWSGSIHPSLDLEIKTELKKVSDEEAINVFGVNLKNLLLQPYLGAKTVLGIDPGIRTGLKLVVIDNTGKFIVDHVVFPHPPQNDKINAAKILDAMIEQFKVEYIAIGNGTYGRETLEFIQETLPSVKSGKVKATMISEQGASIYSASDIARKEFPDKDITVRGAISIARRFQDPLAELVKIDPKSIGVGQYQHDVNQIRLKKSLTAVVEECVNFVGVDLNTASAPLLSFISGIGPSLAENVVKYREEKGGIKSRKELLKISRFTPKIFEQAAGFLRIYNSLNPLDGTFIHPERYDMLDRWAVKNNTTVKELIQEKELIAKLEKDADFKKEIGDYTHEDIVKSLKSPSQDPRTEFKTFDYRKDISSLSDLKNGEWYPGVVTNITQFGAFVDIGLKENGLLHVSQISDQFVENALEALKVGQELKVMVIEVDLERKRISLSCKKGEASAPRRTPQQQNQDRQERSSGERHQQQEQRKPEPQLRNNAFAALKNFKV